jgi:hypothetical protein
MTLLLRIAEHIHGHLGWLTVAALLHPAIVLRNPKRRARLSVVLAAGFVALTWALGAAIYPEYRARLKQHLFIEAPRMGWMFERKEHLAVGVAIFALIGTIAHLSAPAFDDDGTRAVMSRLAHRCFVIAAAVAILVGALGVSVAVIRSF